MGRSRTGCSGGYADDGSAAAGPASAIEAARDSLGTTRERGGAAWDVLRGAPAEAPPLARRWPWALGAAVLGAAVGGVVAAVLRRVGGEDAPGAQDPEEVVAVVDRQVTAPAPPPVELGGAR